MPYLAEITRANSSCFLFLIDQSGSMAQPIAGGDGKKKADFVADTMNRFLQTLVLRCAKSDGIRDHFHVGVIGYGTQAAPALKGALAGQTLVPVSAVANHPLRVEQRTRKIDDGTGGLIEQVVKFPVWFEPLASADGNLLLFNLHISSTPQRPCEFPDREESLPDEFARRLFRMSSLLPERIRQNARSEGIETNEFTRGFVFNADLVAVVKFLEIGTRVDPHNLR